MHDLNTSTHNGYRLQHRDVAYLRGFGYCGIVDNRIKCLQHASVQCAAILRDVQGPCVDEHSEVANCTESN